MYVYCRAGWSRAVHVPHSRLHPVHILKQTEKIKEIINRI